MMITDLKTPVVIVHELVWKGLNDEGLLYLHQIFRCEEITIVAIARHSTIG
jgi:hypothetical protein